MIPGGLSSSELARYVLIAYGALGTLILLSIQLRIMRREPRAVPYIVGAIAAAILLGGFVSLTDYATGSRGLRRVLSNIAGATAGTGLCMIAAYALRRSPGWTTRHAVARFVALTLVNIVVLVFAWLRWL